MKNESYLSNHGGVEPSEIKEQTYNRQVQKQHKDVGKKYDNGKAEWNLLYYPFLESVIRVMKLGKGRYGFENWKKPFDKTRLRNALMRHAVADMKGEYIDKDSGEPHISHIVCNAMFIYFHELKDECSTIGEHIHQELTDQKEINP